MFHVLVSGWLPNVNIIIIITWDEGGEASVFFQPNIMINRAVAVALQSIHYGSDSYYSPLKKLVNYKWMEFGITVNLERSHALWSELENRINPWVIYYLVPTCQSTQSLLCFDFNGIVYFCQYIHNTVRSYNCLFRFIPIPDEFCNM